MDFKINIIQPTGVKKVDDKIEKIKLTSSNVTFSTKNVTVTEKSKYGLNSR